MHGFTLMLLEIARKAQIRGIYGNGLEIRPLGGALRVPGSSLGTPKGV
ncbi:MAG: hypothetical protein QUV08_10125 [Parasphingorhabdus sp.]|jgi:hypothetical protein|nr:hypothetical protein [Parasphingorhabdus sp.]|tara:strand:+ start:2689 stop:2832 length:144 start_codon:yes stop_codon:yes gene_type:complete